MSPDLGAGVLIVGGTAVWTAYSYLGPTVLPGPLADDAHDARAALITRGKSLGGIGMGAASLVLIAAFDSLVPALFGGIDTIRAVWVGMLVWMLAGAALVGAAGGAVHQSRYPEIRLARWTPGWIGRSLGAWALYLGGYELVFRGVLFLALTPRTGLLLAGAVSTGLYVLAHLRKDAAETLSCFAMGPVFCAMAVWGGIVAPIALHFAIAATAELATLWRSPGIRIERG